MGGGGGGIIIWGVYSQMEIFFGRSGWGESGVWWGAGRWARALLMWGVYSQMVIRS